LINSQSTGTAALLALLPCVCQAENFLMKVKNRLLNLRRILRDEAPSLSEITGCVVLDGLGRRRNTDGRSMEKAQYDDGKVRRWLRHIEWLEGRRNR
jgi:hypothetical protein